MCYNKANSSWGLSLFVLFERGDGKACRYQRSWGLSLFVLFEHYNEMLDMFLVLED